MSKQKDDMTATRWERIKSLRNPLRRNRYGQDVRTFYPMLARFYPWMMARGIG